MTSLRTTLSPPTRSSCRRFFYDAHLSELKPRAAICLPSAASLEDVVTTLAANKIGSLLLVDEKANPIGILSEREILSQIAKTPAEWRKIRAYQVMSGSVPRVRALGSIGRAIFEMATAHVRYLVIEQTATTPLGVISIRDILRYVYDALSRPLVEHSSLTQIAKDDLEAFLKGPVQGLSPARAITSKSTDSVQSAVQLMDSHRIGSVLVVSSANKLEGILTDRDFLLKVAASGLEMKSTAIEEVMTKSPRSVLENSSVALALNLMFEGGFRHIPIVNQKEALSGVLSLRDFLSFLNHTLMEDLGG